MPVSIQFQITPCVSKIIGLQPKSVLDVGCGFGKWGYLCREYLDAFNGRFRPEDWTTRIDAVEYFEPYILDHQRALYDNIMIGDIRDLCDGLDEYDLIIAGDVIEHMHKDEAELVVETLYTKAKQMLIVNIPLGEGWDHPEQYGNPAELHRSEWYKEDFQGYALEFDEFTLPTGLAYGAFYCPKKLPGGQQVSGFLSAAEFYSQRQELATAERYARRALMSDPSALEALYMMVDIQVNQGNVDGAVEVLLAGVSANPASATPRLYLAQLLDAKGQRSEACRHLQEAAALKDIEADIRTQVDALLAAWA
ncbi:MAG: tetratricopeptide repeat protein [Candidatus Hydrogenedentes bacterium]|nr:tetratricopeptide repeat protein [Candidatus Hydrogenedentota bacterium]